MGNFCSSLVDGIDYILQLLVPNYIDRHTGYEQITNEDETLPQQIEGNVFPQVSESFDGSHRDASCNNNAENIGKINQQPDNFLACIRNIVNDFFRKYNFQQQILTGNTTERKLQINDKEDNNEITSNSGIVPPKHFKSRYETASSNRSPKDEFAKNEKNNDCKMNDSRNITKDKTIIQRSMVNNDQKGTSFLNRMKERGKITSTSQHIQENFQPEQICNKISSHSSNERDNGDVAYPSSTNEIMNNSARIDEENFNNEHEKQIFSENSRHVRRRRCAIPTEEILSHRNELERKTSNSNQNGEEIVNELKDDYVRDVQVGQKGNCNIRKLSLNNLHSGSHYSVNQENESIEINDYSLDSPIISPFETYRKISNSSLMSGGLVAYEELSRHLSIPNYYAEDPIIYKDFPQCLEVAKSSPIKLISCDTDNFSRTCSGGGIILDVPSRKVSLPDLFPVKDPLLNPYSSAINTQCSTSCGDIVKQEDVQNVIFCEMLAQSAQFDGLMTSQTEDKESRVHNQQMKHELK